MEASPPLTRALVKSIIDRIFGDTRDECTVAEVLELLRDEAGAACTLGELRPILEQLETSNTILLRDQQGGTDGDMDYIHFI